RSPGPMPAVPEPPPSKPGGDTTMRKLLTALTLICSFSLLTTGSAAFAAEALPADIVQLQHDWAKANYHTSEKEQEKAFEALAERARQITEQHANAPEAMIWEAIILSGYAKAKGGLGALKQAEKARDLLLAVEKANPQALQGSAYTTLG